MTSPAARTTARAAAARAAACVAARAAAGAVAAGAVARPPTGVASGTPGERLLGREARSAGLARVVPRRAAPLPPSTTRARCKISWLVVLAATLGSPVLAQDVDCATDGTQLALTVCATRAFEAADAGLNDAYRAAVAAAVDAPQEALLRDAQRAWIPFRDAACAAAADRYRGGSIAPMVAATCLERLTRERTRDLLDFARTE